MHTQAAQALALFDRFKASRPNVLLMIRVGDFYEMFHDDAQTAHRVLGVTLTQREGIPMVAVPYHCVDRYIQRLIVAEHYVALCDEPSPTPAGAA